MEEIYGTFNELDSSQLNYVKAGEFLPNSCKIKYTKVVNEFIQYCAQFKLEPDLDESYTVINCSTIEQINHLHNSAVWFNYISTDYSYNDSTFMSKQKYEVLQKAMIKALEILSLDKDANIYYHIWC